MVAVAGAEGLLHLAVVVMVVIVGPQRKALLHVAGAPKALFRARKVGDAAQTAGPPKIKNEDELERQHKVRNSRNQSPKQRSLIGWLSISLHRW